MGGSNNIAGFRSAALGRRSLWPPPTALARQCWHLLLPFRSQARGLRSATFGFEQSASGAKQPECGVSATAGNNVVRFCASRFFINDVNILAKERRARLSAVDRLGALERDFLYQISRVRATLDTTTNRTFTSKIHSPPSPPSPFPEATSPRSSNDLKKRNLEASPRSSVGMVVGGTRNTAHNSEAVVIGGGDNMIGEFTQASIIGGGAHNLVSGRNGVVIGGSHNQILWRNNFIGGGTLNHARANFATVLGGVDNRAYGRFSLAVGSANRAVGDFSVALGHNAKAIADFSAVFAFAGTTRSCKTDVESRGEIRVCAGQFYVNNQDIASTLERKESRRLFRRTENMRELEITSEMRSLEDDLSTARQRLEAQQYRLAALLNNGVVN